jgi:hypothetical protein
MQRKFKLIKCYPNSPKLGTIIKENGSCYDEGKCGGFHTMTKQDIENNPEFWQEIAEIPVGTKAYNSLIQSTIIRKEDGWYKIPADSDLKTSYTDEDILKQKSFQIVEEVKKDYEILGVTTHIFTGNSTSKIDIQAFEDKVKGTEKWTIKSVKRKSDGEVFQIGDEVDLNYLSGKFSYPIESIIIDKKNNIYFKLKDAGTIPLKSTKHVKKPILFTTEDGVDIKEGAKYYTVFFNNYLHRKAFDKINGPFEADSLHKEAHTRLKFFSTKERAEEYILHNKPCLSINDVKGFLIEGDLKELKELVKSKL